MTSSSSTAASTCTSVPVNYSYYDVFLNHYAPDVKRTFASHLYRSLHSHGLRVFIDLFDLQQGDSLTSKIEGAIRSASVHVAVFSAGYAKSVRCLKELVLMQESNAHIIPVFHNVKPSQLRWTQGKDNEYARALQKLEKKAVYDTETIQIWRTALSTVADIRGFELETSNGDEGLLVDEVVKYVLKVVKKPAVDVATYRIGLTDKLNELEDMALLQRQHREKPQILGIVGLGGVGKTTLANELFNRKNSNYSKSCFQILGIVGLGGVGKTTLAKELFNRKNSNYSKSCFLYDVRENAGKGSLISLQRKLLESLTGSSNPINNVDEGRGLLRQHLSSAKILVILDDVDHMEQVYALLPDQLVLRSGSLVVITSRNKDVLKSAGVEESALYNLTGLSVQHSLELFCLHAFKNPYPLPEYESLVGKFLEACGGLPLSLKVIGALLHGENTSYWENKLHKLKGTLPNDIKQILQVGYDALDMDEQHMFLDIACFFTGEDRDMAIKIWVGSGWNGLYGFQNILYKCLVEVDSKNKIKMHDLLRDLGRDISKASGLPRRHWRWTDLGHQSSVKLVRGIRMIPSEYDIDNDDAFGRIETKGLQLLDTEGFLLERILSKAHSPNLIWLRWKECPTSSLPSWIPMEDLRVLQVFGTKLKTLWNDSKVPLQLLQLEIDAPLSNFPESIGQLKHLQRIVFTGSCEANFTELPKEFCYLRSLEALVFRKCKQMKSLPECFGSLKNLRQMELSQCTSLKRLPDSIGNLTKLQYLNLSMSNKLEMLPDSFGNLTNLQHINMSECSGLERLPNSFGNLTNLQYMDLSTCSKLEKLPSSFGNLNNLQYIDLYDCPCAKLEVLPDCFADMRKLEHITLSSLEDPTDAGMCPAAVGLCFDNHTRSPCPCNPFPCNPSYSGGHNVRFRAGVPQKNLFYRNDVGFKSSITNTSLDKMTSLRNIFVQNSEMWTSRDNVYIFFSF